MRLLPRILLGLTMIVGTFYAADYLAVRTRLPKSVETVTVQPYYAIHDKNGKIEFMMLDPEDDQCVDSLLPHMGKPPCWYLKKHTQKRIDM